MQAELHAIPMREVLHFLGWRGTPVELELLERLNALCRRVVKDVSPRVVLRRFALEADGRLRGTSFCPAGGDVRALLSSCDEAVLLAATLGAQSERLLLQEQARSGAQAVLLDAVLSAAIEAVCDQAEAQLRKELAAQRLYLTDRFSPGYGDMPLEQVREICAVLSVDRAIGLTVSASGVMIPRKSVTAVMGVSRAPVARRPGGCAGCSARETCTMRRSEV